MKEYDLYVPLAYNDGRPVEGRKLVRLRERLLAEFGGLTFFPQPNQGFWTFGGTTYRDDIVIYRVISGKPKSARRFFAQLKEDLKQTCDKRKSSSSKRTRTCDSRCGSPIRNDWSMDRVRAPGHCVPS